jgi:hypothetical protein
MEKKFEKAAREKIRFDSPKGLLMVEDLYDIPLTSQTGKANIDDIARGLHIQLKNSDNVCSFVNKEQTFDEIVQLKFDIVKHIIETRLAEYEAWKIEKSNKEKKQMLLGIIAQKENEKLLNMDLEELKKIVESM